MIVCIVFSSDLGIMLPNIQNAETTLVPPAALPSHPGLCYREPRKLEALPRPSLQLVLIPIPEFQVLSGNPPHETRVLNDKKKVKVNNKHPNAILSSLPAPHKLRASERTDAESNQTSNVARKCQTIPQPSTPRLVAPNLAPRPQIYLVARDRGTRKSNQLFTISLLYLETSSFILAVRSGILNGFDITSS